MCSNPTGGAHKDAISRRSRNTVNQEETSMMLQSEKDILAFAALDFKLSLNNKASSKISSRTPKPFGSLGIGTSQTVSGSCSYNIGAVEVNMVASKQSPASQPRPVAEGKESVSIPNILTSSLPGGNVDRTISKYVKC